MPHLPHRAAGSMTAEKPAQFFLRRPFGSAESGKHVQDAARRPPAAARRRNLGSV